MMRKRNPVQPRKTMLIVTSNPALAVYFSRVRKDCRYVSLTVECQAADSLENLIKVTAKRRIAGKYSSAWAVFTFDDFGIKAGDVPPQALAYGASSTSSLSTSTLTMPHPSIRPLQRCSLAIRRRRTSCPTKARTSILDCSPRSAPQSSMQVHTTSSAKRPRALQPQLSLCCMKT